MNDLIARTGGRDRVAKQVAEVTDSTFLEQTLKLLANNQVQMAANSCQFPMKMADALSRDASLKEIGEVSESTTGWKKLATMTACEVFKDGDNFIACLRALSKKMPTLDEEIKAVAKEVANITKDQWNMIKVTVIRADNDDATALTELGDQVITELGESVVRTPGKMDKHLGKAQKMLRMTKGAHTLLGFTLPAPMMVRITSAFMKGLYTLVNDAAFERDTKFHILMHKKTPMTLKEGHDRVKAYLLVKGPSKENKPPVGAGASHNKRHGGWINPPAPKRVNNGLRLGFHQNSMFQPSTQASALTQINDWKNALETISPTEEQANTAEQLTQADTVSSLLGSLQSVIIGQQAVAQRPHLLPPIVAKP